MLWLQIFWKSIERRAISLPNDDKLKEYIGPTSRTDDPVPEGVGTAHPLLTRVFDIWFRTSQDGETKIVLWILCYGYGYNYCSEFVITTATTMMQLKFTSTMGINRDDEAFYCYCYHHHESVVNLSTSSIIRERPTVCPNGASRLGNCARADAACWRSCGIRKDARKEGATDNPRCCPSSKAANEYYDYYYYYYYYYYYISYKTICSSPQEIIPIPCYLTLAIFSKTWS